MLGTTGESANTIEENTHIAYLCDLLERIWGHGLKKREVKNVLYTRVFVCNFQDADSGHGINSETSCLVYITLLLVEAEGLSLN